MFDIFYSGNKPCWAPHEQPADSIEQAQQLSRTRYFWWVTYLADPSTVDLLWEPVPWESHQRHAWASQWQKDSGVYLVPKTWNGQDTNYHTQQVKRITGVPVVEIDHMDGNAGQIANTVKTVRYFDNYRDTLTRIAKSLRGQYEYVWVCSSVCDYTDFDFSWHPDPWQLKLLHIFPSNEQKFGDTFLMHVDSFADRIVEFDLLDWYDNNFVQDVWVPRRSMPVVSHTKDCHVDAVKQHQWASPLTLFTTGELPMTIPTVSLWREKTKTVIPLSAGASAVIVPQVAVGYVKTQLYDYPYIDKTNRNRMSDPPLDIVFIENGEPSAQRNYERLLIATGANFNSSINRIHRVSNVNGRAAAYHAAAAKSTTPWFFAVFAKLSVAPEFKWSWQPDRMQQPKHYIFHAYNPCNGLEYGHQAMIAYNRQLVLSNPGQGLDFTLDSEHEVVPINSGTAGYTDTAWSAWRTAFRECIKLRANLPDVESEYRLKQWLTQGNGLNGEWSVRGAEDAVEYYESVNGDFDALKKSYEWAWLASYALIKRNLTPNQ